MFVFVSLCLYLSANTAEGLKLGLCLCVCICLNTAEGLILGWLEA